MVINPDTPISHPILKEVLGEKGLIDNVLVMTVKPGFGGQSFMEE